MEFDEKNGMLHFSEAEQQLTNWPETVSVEVLPNLYLDLQSARVRNSDMAQAYASDPIRSRQQIARRLLSQNVMLSKLGGQLHTVGRQTCPELFSDR